MPVSARFSLILLAPLLAFGAKAPAQEHNVLAQCRAQSLEIDQIHACLDGYLDSLDNNVRALMGYLERSLSGEALSGLARSQQAFIEYRRQNCLWYLDFSSPRIEAEQIAKNCLADMTHTRFQELTGLIGAGESAVSTLDGLYVFDADRNSFQPCEGPVRLWVEGDVNAVNILQQLYLSEANSDSQPLQATLVGVVKREGNIPAGYQGIFELVEVLSVRDVSNVACANAAGTDIASAEIEAPDNAQDLAANDLDDPQSEKPEPEQQLTAIFRDWVVDCVEFDGRKSCSVTVELNELGAQVFEEDGIGATRLIIYRQDIEGTYAELNFPMREIDSPNLIRWKVDDETFGDIVGSAIRVDQLGTRQLVGSDSVLKKGLLQGMLRGNGITITVLQTVDDATGDTFVGSLIGLTKALAFADDFVKTGG